MGVGCELCTIVLSAAKALVENKVEQEKVLGFIETQLCARLGSLNATCIEYVKVEGANIIDMLEHSVVSSSIHIESSFSLSKLTRSSLCQI